MLVCLVLLVELVWWLIFAGGWCVVDGVCWLVGDLWFCLICSVLRCFALGCCCDSAVALCVYAFGLLGVGVLSVLVIIGCLAVARLGLFLLCVC